MSNYEIELQVQGSPSGELTQQVDGEPGGGSVSAREAEAWARGTRAGMAVSSDDPTYHNNSKYYAEQAHDAAESASAAYGTDLLAPTFDASQAYPAGAHVIHDGGYYVLPEGHTAGDTWAETSKTQQTVGGEVTGLKSAIGTVPTGKTVQGQIEALQTGKADMIVVTDSTPAAVMTFADGADGQPMALEVGIDPVQDLHGQSNPYPGGAGKNLLSVNRASTYEANGVTFTVNKDNGGNVVSVKANGTSTSIIQSNLYSTTYNEVMPLAAGTYILTGGSPSVAIRVADSNGTYITKDQGSGATFTADGNGNIFQFLIESGVQVNNVLLYPMLRLSTESDATFAPYSNICPISGWTGANVGVAEHYSPIRPDAPTTMFTDHGVTYDVSKYPFIKASGTAMGGNAYSGMIGTTYQSFRLPAGTHTLKAIGNIDNVAATFQFEIGSGLSNASITKDNPSITITLTAEYGIGWYLVTNNGKTTDSLFAIVYEEGQAYEYPFPQAAGTVYGGTLTLNQDGTGLLVVDRACVELSPDWEWKADTSYTNHAFYGFSSNIPIPKNNTWTKLTNIVCDRYMADKSSDIDRGVKDATISEVTHQNGTRIWVCDKRFTSVSDFKASLTGAKCVYEIATPVSYALTAPQVKTLLGVNNIWADTGDILSVDYPADTKLYIDGKFASLQALILENISNT